MSVQYMDNLTGEVTAVSFASVSECRNFGIKNGLPFKIIA